MYLANEPSEHSEAFKALEHTFGSETFSKGDALEALRVAGVDPGALSRLIQYGHVIED